MASAAAALERAGSGVEAFEGDVACPDAGLERGA
jgi:hypothetical protein